MEFKQKESFTELFAFRQILEILIFIGTNNRQPSILY